MRIAQLADFPVHLLPGLSEHRPRGHYPTWLAQLSEAWTNRADLDLHWITIVRHFKHPEPIRWRGQTFHLLHRPGKLRPLRLYLKDCRLIRAKLDELQPDLVHAWGTEDCYGLTAAKSGRRFLLSMQGLLVEYLRRGLNHPFELIQAAIEVFILKRCRDITVESTWGCDIVKQQAPHARVHQVEYGVDPLFYYLKWQPEPTKPVAIFVGTAGARKGIQDAVSAFSNPSLSNAELWILSDRDFPYAKKLQQVSAPNVRWLGRQSREETARLMSKSWCLVLPTRADTSPNVVKESRVIGLPVITTPNGGQRDYIKDGVNGWLVKPGDIAALTQRLVRTLGNLEETRRFGEAGQAEQREWFRPERTAGAFEAVYREITPMQNPKIVLPASSDR